MEVLSESSALINTENKRKSLSLVSAVAYIVSLFGIPPIITLPGALEYCGVLGFIIIPILILIQAYTAILLGKSWLIMEENWQKETFAHAKYPYSALARKVGGDHFKRFVGLIQKLAIFGEAVPFLLLGTENIQALINAHLSSLHSISFCFLLILMALVITPILWLGTPKSLRYITWLSGLCIVLLWCCVMYLTVENAPKNPPSVVVWPSNWLPYAYTFGTVAFQLGVHPILLTVQMDMKDKKQLTTACILSFAVVLLFYGLLAILVYTLYGSSVKENLLHNFPNSHLLYFVKIIVGIQAIICLALGLNALFQDLEELLGMPDSFGWQRVLLRTSIMFLVLFVAESIPHFAISLDLVGGLLMTPIVFIFPPIFYNGLKYKVNGVIHRGEAAIGAVIVIIGIIGCVASTVESGIQIYHLKEFAPPCYMNINNATM